MPKETWSTYFDPVVVVVVDKSADPWAAWNDPWSAAKKKAPKGLDIAKLSLRGQDWECPVNVDLRSACTGVALMDDTSAQTWVARRPIATDALAIITLQELHVQGAGVNFFVDSPDGPMLLRGFLYQLGEGEGWMPL